MRQTVKLLVNNKPGVLARVVGQYSRRGVNIDSMTVVTAEKPELSLMTIDTSCDEAMLAQIIKQLSKQIDVLSVERVSTEEEES